jgi:chromosome partitioning protein
MRTITFSNNKGGSGKTTSVVSLAGVFAEMGLRVLVVDLDPQGSATYWLRGEESSAGLVELGNGGVRASQLARSTTVPGLELLPISPSVVASGETTPNDTGLAIVRGFARLPDYWDVVMIDTPPTVGYLSLAPIVASDHVVVPVEAHALALPGVASVVETIKRARQRVNPRVDLLGIVASRANATRHTRDVVAQLHTRFGSAVLQETVRESIRLAEAPALQLPITQSAPQSGATHDYRAIAHELLDRMGGTDSLP